METKSKKIFCDYTAKINFKLTGTNIEPTEINNTISLLNYCFNEKNGFFIINFNKNQIKEVYLLYNTFKTNILSIEIADLFLNISKKHIKLLRFILINFVNNYEKIIKNNDRLCLIEKQSIQKMIHFLSELSNI